MKSAFGAIVAAVVLLSLAAPVAAGPFEDAVAAYKRGATPLPILRPLADQSNSQAQFILGLLYRRGQGVPRQGHGGGAGASSWPKTVTAPTGDDQYDPNAIDEGVQQSLTDFASAEFDPSNWDHSAPGWLTPPVVSRR